MNSELQALTDRYLCAREAVKSVFRMESEYSFPVAANLYAAANRPVDEQRLMDCKRLIKEQAGIFSNFRGNIMVPLASKLALSDDPQDRWNRAQANYAVLKTQFSRSEFLALAALLLTDSAADADVPALAERGKTIYRRMKANHPFLTGQEDSVFAVLLAESGRTDDELIADMEASYRLLDARFPKGDGLQTASHVLAMTDGAPETKAERVIALYDAIKAAGGRFGKEWQLPTLAAFAGCGAPTEEIVSDILSVDALLDGQKGYRTVFGYDRKTRMMHAAMLVASFCFGEQPGLSDAVAQQSAVAMIAAQQAALCAMIACNAAAASAAAGSAH